MSLDAMAMLRRVRDSFFFAARSAGAMELVRRSEWRRKRLLILCLHGISIEDEHEWNPTLFMRQEVLRARLAQLKRGGYPVLPLGEAVERLWAGTLPQGAVALTFDDGTFDFYSRAFPVLQEFGFPATVYQTTLYSEFGRPVFDVFTSYLLWKARARTVDLAGVAPGGYAGPLDTRAARERALLPILRHSVAAKLDEVAKHDLLERVATALGVDIAAIEAKRILSLMNSAEISELAAKGVDFQLHTHRHDLPLDRGAFARDLETNASLLTSATGKAPRHFCYPSGLYRRDVVDWLRQERVVTATTCDPGLAHAGSAPLLLPRFVVTEQASELTFESWASGLAAIVPRRTRVAHPEAIGL
ncbi:MAG TPA: polysaccharide deacetylase family protein [Gemmatimonadaceae bacterium]|nr:polysaccharide deacetylase family protein [Gemmatimonadaceae bacterium]